MKFHYKSLFMVMVLLFVFVMNSASQAQVRVVRSGQENPVVTIGKSTLYGGATGLLLGLALALVLEQDTGDIIRWSFVSGTFGGFLVGVYHVANRPQPSSAMLQFNSTGLAKIRLPKPELRLGANSSLGLRVNLVSLSL